jgi:hypothetical protein
MDGSIQPQENCHDVRLAHRLSLLAYPYINDMHASLASLPSVCVMSIFVFSHNAAFTVIFFSDFRNFVIF